MSDKRKKELGDIEQSDSYKSSNDKSVKIKAIIKRYRNKIKDSAIYFEPDIPVSKLKNVLHSYAKDAVFEESLILIDNTFFGAATDGGLLTTEKIYAHNIFDAPQHFAFEEIETVEFQESANKALYVNKIKFIEINFPEAPPMRAFAEMLREITYLYNPELKNQPTGSDVAPTKAPDRSPFEALKELKQLLDAGIITNEEFEEKKKKYLERI